MIGRRRVSLSPRPGFKQAQIRRRAILGSRPRRPGELGLSHPRTRHTGRGEQRHHQILAFRGGRRLERCQGILNCGGIASTTDGVQAVDLLRCRPRTPASASIAVRVMFARGAIERLHSELGAVPELGCTPRRALPQCTSHWRDASAIGSKDNGPATVATRLAARQAGQAIPPRHSFGSHGLAAIPTRLASSSSGSPLRTSTEQRPAQSRIRRGACSSALISARNRAASAP
jgi:hypothetical protein